MSPDRPETGVPVPGFPRESGPPARSVVTGSLPGSTRTIWPEPGRVANTVPAVLTASTTRRAPTVATGDATSASTVLRSVDEPTHRRPSARSATATVPERSDDLGAVR